MNKSIHKYKPRLLKIYVIIFSFLFSFSTYAQFVDLWTTNTITASTTSEHKPQSKVWYYGGYWWAIIPISDPEAGTFLWKLNSTTWTRLIKLSTFTTTQADALVDGNLTHILLYAGASNSKFITIEYVSGAYQIKNPPGLVNLANLGSDVETATIAIDSNDKIWLAWESSTTIKVRWSSPPYSTWSSNIELGTGVNGDDICAITAFDGNKIGVLWSNQNSREFLFKYRLDTNNVNIWSALEVAAPDSNGTGNGIADDHINLAVGIDGTIYAAVKTSYDISTLPTIALLERKPNPVLWTFYGVSNGNDTRPIALLDQNDGKIYILYHRTNGGVIKYQYSPVNPINLPSTELRLNQSDNTIYQDITSTKQNFTSEVAILFYKTGTSTYEWTGVLAGTEPLPVELASFTAAVMEDRIILNWRTETEISNYGFDIERAVENLNWEKLGFVEGHGNSNSPKDYSFADYDISRAGKYKYRLKQIDNDGKFEYSYVISVYVGAPANFYLSQNYPNPFNPATKIDYSVPQASQVSLKVYDILGREVASLVDEYKETGTYTVTFDASNLAGGIYLYVISAGDFVQTKKMSLIK